MRRNQSQLNILASVVIALGALGYFALRSGHHSSTDEPAVNPPRAVSQPPSPEAALAPQPGQTQTPPVGETLSAEEKKARGIPENLPDDMVRALINPPPELPPDFKSQLRAAPPELPDDLRRQLESPPPELPDDLKAQLQAPPPELPEDIKRALATPPRTVTIDEVNNPHEQR